MKPNTSLCLFCISLIASILSLGRTYAQEPEQFRHYEYLQPMHQTTVSTTQAESGARLILQAPQFTSSAWPTLGV